MSTAVERAETCFLFDQDVDLEALVAVIRSVADRDDIELGKHPDRFASAIQTGEALSTSIKRGATSARLTVGHDPPERLPELPGLTLSLDETYFRPGADEAETTAHVGDYVDCVRRCYEAAGDAGHTPVYVVGADPNQLGALLGDYGTVKTTLGGVFDGEVQQLYWLQVLSPDAVERLGRDQVLSTPAWRVESLNDGAVLIVAYPDPHFPANVDEIETHLGFTLPTYWT